jgi:hypothetical protein
MNTLREVPQWHVIECRDGEQFPFSVGLSGDFYG